MRTTRLVFGALLFLLVFQLAAPFFSPKFSVQAQQATEGEWIDLSRIKYDGNIYKDSDPYDGTRDYVFKNSEGCENRINGFPSGDWDSQSANEYIDNSKNATVHIFSRPPGGKCQEDSSIKIKLVNENGEVQDKFASAYSRGEFRYVDAGRIERWDGNGNWIFTRPNIDSKDFFKASEKNEDCQDLIRVGDNPLKGTLYELTDDPPTNSPGGRPPEPISSGPGKGCYPVSDIREIYISRLGKLTVDIGTGNTLGGDGSGTAPNSEVECDAGPGLTWILCSIIKFVKNTVDWIQTEIIIPFLTVPPLSTDSAAFDVWKNIRNIANILLVPVFFVIIFSQAASLNIDAYTIKKILPRLLIAVIAIQFSYYIVAIAVDIFNVLGNGLGELIAGAIGSPDYNLTTGSSLLVAAGVGLGAFALVSAAATGAIFLLLIPLLFAMLGVFFTLVFRQILIIMLAILAPIAFVAWVLPNTEKFFKIWWDFLLKALMMYPLIVLLFAAGNIVAVISQSVNSGPIGEGATIGNLIALAAIIVPLALIPATFKFAGTAIAGISGGLAKLSGRVQGGADGKGGLLGNQRTKVAKRKADIGAGLRPDNRLGRAAMRVPGIRQAAIIGAAPGLGVGRKSKALAATQFNEQMNAATKDLEAKGFNNGQVLAEFAEHGRSAGALKSRIRTLTMSGNPDDLKTAQELEGTLGMAGQSQYLAAAGLKAAEQGRMSDGAVQSLAETLKPNRTVQSQVIGGINFAAKGKDITRTGHTLDGAGNYTGNKPEAVRQGILKMSSKELSEQLDLSKADSHIKQILAGVEGTQNANILKDKLRQAAGIFTGPLPPGTPPGAGVSTLSVNSQRYVDDLRSSGLI